jgi:DNA-binding NarL/FixJ family response regulator
MAVQGQEDFDWRRITFARACVLRELEDARTEREIAERLHMTHNGVRSYVEDLKAITGCDNVREIGRWWRTHRDAWYGWCAEVAGIRAS